MFTEEDLWLNDLGLDSIPSEIGLLPQLERLNLDNNNLTSIPKELGDLSQLEVLYLLGNPLSKKEVDKLKKMLPNCEVYVD